MGKLGKKVNIELMKRPIVSVVMPVFNGSEFLNRSINSILNQTFKEFELIIIDDFSSDNSLDIILEYTTDPRIKLIKNNKNLGISKSLNKGIELSEGKYIARMDCDDYSLPDRLLIQVKFMNDNLDIGFLGTPRIILRNGINKIFNNTGSSNYQIKSLLSFENCLAHPTMIFRKSEIIKYKLFYKNTYAEDYDLWCRAIIHTKFHNLSIPLLIYAEHDNQYSITKIKKHNLAFKNIRLQYLKNFNIIQKGFMFIIYVFLKIRFYVRF